MVSRASVHLLLLRIRRALNRVLCLSGCSALALLSANRHGGAVVVDDGSPTVRLCLFIGNQVCLLPALISSNSVSVV